MNFIKTIFTTIENFVSKGDKYYDKIIIASNFLNAIYIILFSVFGISLIQNHVMRSFNTTVQMFICILLLIKFHPFREHSLGRSDAKIIFSGATFLFVNLGLIEMLNRIKHKITGKIDSNVESVDSYIDNINEQMDNLNEQLDTLNKHMDTEGFENEEEGFEDDEEGFEDDEEGFDDDEEGFEGFDDDEEGFEGFDDDEEGFDNTEGLDADEEGDNKKEGLEDEYKPYM